MSNSRNAIFQAIANKLGRDTAPAEGTINEQLSALPPCPRPVNRSGTLSTLNQQLKAANAELTQVDFIDAIPTCIKQWLEQNELPLTLSCGDSDPVGGASWHKAGITLIPGRASPNQSTSLSWALAGVAETGSLIIGNSNPPINNWLVENHIIIIHEHDVLPYCEDAWQRIRLSDPGQLEGRGIFWISGPSSTADIMKTLVFGAHGPLRLLVIVVGASVSEQLIGVL